MTDVLAALDLGTNSFHLVVARIGNGDRFEVIAREKELVRLGSGGGDMTELEPEAIERGIAALNRLRRVAEVHGADVYAVATSAVREAANADEFLRRARNDAGVDVQVVSGQEEARLIHLGVLQALPVFDSRLLLMDIGGGSTEFLVGERGDTLAVASLKVGALRLTQRFFGTSRLHPSAVDACRRWLRAELVPVARPMRELGYEVAVGTSGTIATLCAMAQAQRGGESRRTFNGFAFTAAELDGVVGLLTEAETIEDRRRLPGLDSSRADIILAGALIAQAAMAAFRIDEMVYSDYALREGALLDALHRRRGGTLHHLHDLRRRSVEHLAELMDNDPGHRATAARLALRLFDLTQPWHGASDQARELLEAAALLANVGMFVAHSGHHKHTYYVIRNSEHLAGFTDNEIEVIAQAARYHRKSPPKQSHPDFAALTPEHQRTVRVLAGILRVAIALDRTHDDTVAALTLVDDSTSTSSAGDDDDPAADAIVIGVEPRPGASVELALYTATDRKSLLEDVLGHSIRLVEVPAAVSA
jgi:exopolyphosphatase / guanosine-5'-triphosphate,3'-diphosphate pyrophosphatase